VQSLGERANPCGVKMKAIETNGLTKVYGDLVAVDHVSLQVDEGEVFGLLGANGAGKTSIMMMLATALNPTAGSALVAGHDIVKERDRVRESIAMVFQELSLDVYLTGRENLDFHARLHRLPGESRDERIAEALDLVDLGEKGDVLVKFYSGGMQRRLEIARVMLTRPRLLFLDEPTLGLDVQTRRLLWDYAKRLNRESGTTMLLNTHYVEEADYLCGRVAMLDGGRIVATGSPQSLKATVGNSLLSVKASNEASAAWLAELLAGMDWVEGIDRHDSQLQVRMGGERARIPEVVRLARTHGFAISSVGEHRPSLEDVFLHYAGRGLEGEEGV